MDKDKTGQSFPVGSIVELFDIERMMSIRYQKGDTFQVTGSELFTNSKWAINVTRLSDNRKDTFYAYRFRLANPYTDGDWT